MIYWNQQENPNLDFDKWDYSGVGANTEYDYKYLIRNYLKKTNLNYKEIENIIIEYIKEFKKYLDLYNIPYSVDYLWSNYDTETLNTITNICINIYYPEIIITNGKEQEKLLDLYFAIVFDSRGHIILKGTRETYSEKHYMYNYTHSHLPGSTSKNILDNSFCLGSGVLSSLISLINNSINSVKRNQEINLRSDCVKGVIMNIKSYLEWESEAGGPYIRMSGLGIKKINLSSYIYEINYTDEILYFINSFNGITKFIAKNINLSNVKFRLENNNNLRLFKLVVDKNFITELEKTLDIYNKTNGSLNSKYIYKFINNELYEFDENRIIDKSFINKPIFIRNHETIYRKVIKIEDDLDLTKTKKYSLPSKINLVSIITLIEYIYNYKTQLKIKNYNNDRTTVSTTIRQ